MRALQQPETSGPDFIRLRYRADVDLLTARWQRPVSGEELRRGYAALLAAAQAAGCRAWLIDLRGRTAPSGDDAQWLTTAFLPPVPALLGGPVRVGLLLPPRFVFPFRKYPPTPGPPAENPQLQVRFFAEEAALTAWLTQAQAPAPAPA